MPLPHKTVGVAVGVPVFGVKLAHRPPTQAAKRTSVLPDGQLPPTAWPQAWNGSVNSQQVSGPKGVAVRVGVGVRVGGKVTVIIIVQVGLCVGVLVRVGSADVKLAVALGAEEKVYVAVAAIVGVDVDGAVWVGVGGAVWVDVVPTVCVAVAGSVGVSVGKRENVGEGGSVKV